MKQLYRKLSKNNNDFDLDRELFLIDKETNSSQSNESLLNKLTNLFSINVKREKIFSKNYLNLKNSLLEQNSHTSTMTSRLATKEFKTPFVDTSQNDSYQFIYIDYALEGDTTLHSISMNFGVPVSDLKRINCLQNDRDIFALKSLKIPIKPNSVLSEKYADKLKYSDVSVTRLNTNIKGIDAIDDVKVNSEDDHSVDDDSDIKSVTSNPTEPDLDANIKNYNNAETSFNGITSTVYINDDDVNEFETDATTLLLSENSIQNNSKNKSGINKQSREAKKYFKKLDNNLESLKTQNNEILSNVIKSQESDDGKLIPISNISYYVENRSNNKMNGSLFSSKKSLINLNVRDTLIIACIVIVLFPLGIILYRFVMK